jgi:hypothetical protein
VQVVREAGYENIRYLGLRITGCAVDRRLFWLAVRYRLHQFERGVLWCDCRHAGLPSRVQANRPQLSITFSCRRDIPSNRAFSSIANVRWKISPSTTAVLFSLTRLAWMVPLTWPPIVNSSATTSPSICAPSAISTAEACTLDVTKNRQTPVADNLAENRKAGTDRGDLGRRRGCSGEAWVRCRKGVFKGVVERLLLASPCALDEKAIFLTWFTFWIDIHFHLSAVRMIKITCQQSRVGILRCTHVRGCSPSQEVLTGRREDVDHVCIFGKEWGEWPEYTGRPDDHSAGSGTCSGLEWPQE